MIRLSNTDRSVEHGKPEMPEYETIRAAVAGENGRWRKLECYKDEIDRLSTVAVRQPDGSKKSTNMLIYQKADRRIL